MRFNQFVSEMDSQGYSGSRDKKSHSKYGSRDDYELGEPETTLGPDSIMKPEDVVKNGVSALHKAWNRALDTKPVSKAQKERNKERWAKRQAEREQGVAEGVQDSLELQDAAKVLRQYGATNLKTTSNELHFYKDGRPFSVDLIFNDNATRSVSLSQLNAATRKLKGQGVAEGAGNIGTQIKAAYQKIYDAGDDAIEFAYNDSPIFAQYWDEYEGDLDSIIAEVDPKELQIILDELESAVEDQGIGEAYTVTRGFDKDRYQERPGLEGPFSTKSGKVVYYDKVEGKYYDPDTDMYIEYDDWRAMNEGGSALSQAVREAGWGRRSSYYNPMDQERREQDQMDYERRAFKRAEMQHELGHEDDPNFERNLRQQQIDRDRGPWYIRIDGVVYKQKGQPKSFDWKRGANNYALAMMKNNPSLQGKIMLTKSAEDK